MLVHQTRAVRLVELDDPASAFTKTGLAISCRRRCQRRRCSTHASTSAKSLATARGVKRMQRGKSLCFEPAQHGSRSERSEEVADRLGWQQSVIAKIETAQRRIDMIELIRLAAVVGFDAARLVREIQADMTARGEINE